ncbi:MAG TPA: hypothetical protein VK184_06480 [Nostocaceae cyanobacterium]|nr:hypothetical protein [Nostocaceae cyanobacterium]
MNSMKNLCYINITIFRGVAMAKRPLYSDRKAPTVGDGETPSVADR